MNSLFLMEFLLFDGAALVWAGWEIWSVRPGKDQAETAKKPSPSRETPRHPEG
jgi:threonine/homoserine/homoserine lactone efflux protein